MPDKVTENGTTNPPFLWVGTRLCLDFINTTPVIQGREVELIATPLALLAWVSEAGVFGPPQLRQATLLGPKGLKTALSQGLRLRAAIRKAMSAVLAGSDVGTAEIAVLNQFVAKPTLQVSAARSSGAVRLGQQWLVNEPTDLLRPIAHDALHLISSPDLAKVRRCENPECVGVFLDTSKAGRRRWCCMAVCGNRAKVAGFRARRRG